MDLWKPEDILEISLYKPIKNESIEFKLKYKHLPDFIDSLNTLLEMKKGYRIRTNVIPVEFKTQLKL